MIYKNIDQIKNSNYPVVIIGSGPGAVIGIKVGNHKLITRITQRSLNVMDLKLGKTCFAFLKSVSVATSDIIV